MFERINAMGSPHAGRMAEVPHVPLFKHWLRPAFAPLFRGCSHQYADGLSGPTSATRSDRGSLTPRRHSLLVRRTNVCEQIGSGDDVQTRNHSDKVALEFARFLRLRSLVSAQRPWSPFPVSSGLTGPVDKLACWLTVASFGTLFTLMGTRDDYVVAT